MLNTSPGGRTALAAVEKRLTGIEPDESDIPVSVRKSVRFMLGGAAASLVGGLFTAIATLADPALINSGKQPTSTVVSGSVVVTLVSTAVYCALWVAMARFNRSGLGWARIAASVLFAISTYFLYGAINSLHSGEYIDIVYIVNLVLAIVEWLLGLAAVAMLWRTEAGQYIRDRASR
jgi:hypothetical protein